MATALHKCHFSQGKTNIRECHRQKCHPCLGKTIRAESVSFVVVRLAYTECIIFIKISIEHDNFSPNALKHILSENQAASLEQDETLKIARGVWFS